MNKQFWGRPATGPALNFDLCNLLSVIYEPTSFALMRTILGPVYSQGVVFSGLPATSVIPPVVYCQSDWGLAVLVGGTSGNTHVPALLAGWQDMSGGQDAGYGASPAFAAAARVILGAGDANFWLSQKNIYLVGHSYGGACCQALGLLLRGAAFQLRGIWSYGSPRPGTPVMATAIANMPAYRFFGDDDPVRFIPPHSNEVSVLDTFSSLSFVAGMNDNVQTETGLEIDKAGNVVATMGEPTVLHAVALSIFNWCVDNNGFRSVNHSVAEYRRRFQLALPIKPDGPAIPSSQPAEPTGTLRPREIAAEQAAQMPTIEAAVADPSSPLNAEIRRQPVNVPGVRFKRRRDGSIWVVRYNDETVDVGPTKRKAGQLARRYNRLNSGR